MTQPLARAAKHRQVRTRRQWRLNVPSLLVALVGVFGVFAFMYPTVADWFSQLRQSDVVEQYMQDVETGLYPTAEEQIRLAHEYNEALQAGAIYPSGERIPVGDGASSSDLQYDDMLVSGDSGTMGRMQIPAINLDLPIFHGTDDATLLQGLGHLEGTSLPVGGSGTRSVITGHRGLADAAMFTYLDRLKQGDTFTVNILGEVLTYRVTEIDVVLPEETTAIAAVPGKDLMTLVTCTPLGVNSHRILVTGERVWPTPVDEEALALESPTIPSFPWWIFVLVGSLFLAGVWVWRFGLETPREEEQKETGDSVA